MKMELKITLYEGVSMGIIALAKKIDHLNFEYYSFIVDQIIKCNSKHRKKRNIGKLQF